MQAMNAVRRTSDISPCPTKDETVTALLLSRLPVAAVLLDDKGQVAQANLAARLLLERDDGLGCVDEKRLRASLPGEDRRLRQALGPALLAARRSDDSALACPPVRIERPSGQPPLLLIVDRVLRQPPTFGAGSKAMLLVRIVNLGHEQVGKIYPLRAMFELTAAETRVAELIATGRSPADAARHLALSMNTVRTHLTRIFDKTGVRSLHALVRLLMALGSWPAA